MNGISTYLHCFINFITKLLKPSLTIMFKDAIKVGLQTRISKALAETRISEEAFKQTLKKKQLDFYVLRFSVKYFLKWFCLKRLSYLSWTSSSDVSQFTKEMVPFRSLRMTNSLRHLTLLNN